MDPDQTASVGAVCADNLCKQFACTYSQRLLSSVDNLCKQFGPRPGPTASQDRMQRVLNSHGQENQFFNDRHKIIANNIIKSCGKLLWQLAANICSDYLSFTL